jgi:DNA-binding NarL/FixJ family response regulator
VAEHDRIRVLLVDDQRLMREGLRTLLELHQDMHRQELHFGDSRQDRIARLHAAALSAVRHNLTDRDNRD